MPRLHPMAVAVCLLLVLVCAPVALAADASDDLPPPPAPAAAPTGDLPAQPAAPRIDEEPVELAPAEAAPGAEAPVPSVDVPAEVVEEEEITEEVEKDPCEWPAPATRPCDICPPPCGPTACGEAPCGRLSKNACCWPRDDCGWAIGPCGGRRGRTEIVLEGAFTLFDDMEGLVGEAIPAGANGLTWDENDYDGEFGGRITLRHAITPKDKVEARGVWYGDFAANSSQNGVLGFSPPAGGVTPAVNGTLSNTSEAMSLEVNWVREVCCKGRWRWSTILGMRYIGLDESARGDFVLGAVAPVNAFARSQVDTTLIAGQLGASGQWLVTERTEIGITGKVLLGSLYSGIDVEDDSIFVGGPHNAAATDTSFGLGGEIEVSLTHWLTRDLGLTAGYTLLFVNDVVRANQAMDFSQAGTGAVQARHSRSEL
ncbi:MAG: hypothetical protein P1V36_15025, partial [Planctomycetota bacterium]|nr:hypothetical protein [Planctomycetota bacterium]